MGKHIVMIVMMLLLLPFTALADCYEGCYDSTCDVPGACQAECDNDCCYYYDDDGNCWKYDSEFGFYPCDCDSYQCDNICDHDNCCDHDHDCDCHHHHDDDDDYWGYYSCFIGAITLQQ